ncbi:S8 family peptidase [Pelagovum sp. HNIBRBA483]|uniref:S8 family peptidase n=1 Tax=Pelagovum sp. HNIBRBA483 TaxID=3233341 RepID=UPI0034A33403
MIRQQHNGQKAAWLLLGVCGVLLSACQDSTTPDPDPPVVPDDPSWETSFFSEGFVTAWDAFETAARNLRERDSQYTVQDYKQGGYDVYPLAASRIEYAHAAGLDGSTRGDGGKEIVIAVIDDGFYIDHPAFAGKDFYFLNGADGLEVVDGDRVYVPSPDGNNSFKSHGTAVASVLAGDAAGVMVGVAPGAKLALGDYNNYETLTEATREAIALGAIVQSNSWGYVGLDVASSGLGDAFVARYEGDEYYQALIDFAEVGVVVWALDNETSATSADILAGLPAKNPALESSWIAVANGMPTFNDERILSVDLISSACLEAAKWCITADGTWYSASYNDQHEYDYVRQTGTSFATPTVSGALALLAQAFPDHTPQQLRKRLLASADNSYFTEVDGTLDFGNGVSHSYNETYGHGFLDVRAALLPIGGNVIALSNGEVIEQDTPILRTGSAFGAAATKALHGVTVLASDALDADFELQADSLVAQSRAPSTGAYRVQQLADFSGPSGDFGAALGGYEVALKGQGSQITATYRPDSPDFALSFAEQGSGALSLGATIGHDSGGILGFATTAGSGSALAALDIGWEQTAPSGARFSLSGQVGLAAPDARTLGGGDLGPVPVSAFELAAVVPTGRNDQLSFAIGMPFGAAGGTARLPVPVARQASGSGYSYDTIEIDLAPEARQIDLTLAYELALDDDASMLIGGYHSLNFGHEKDQTDTGLVLSWQKRF